MNKYLCVLFFFIVGILVYSLIRSYCSCDIVEGLINPCDVKICQTMKTTSDCENVNKQNNILKSTEFSCGNLNRPYINNKCVEYIQKKNAPCAETKADLDFMNECDHHQNLCPKQTFYKCDAQSGTCTANDSCTSNDKDCHSSKADCEKNCNRCTGKICDTKKTCDVKDGICKCPDGSVGGDCDIETKYKCINGTCELSLTGKYKNKEICETECLGKCCGDPSLNCDLHKTKPDCESDLLCGGWSTHQNTDGKYTCYSCATRDLPGGPYNYCFEDDNGHKGSCKGCGPSFKEFSCEDTTRWGGTCVTACTGVPNFTTDATKGRDSCNSGPVPPKCTEEPFFRQFCPKLLPRCKGPTIPNDQLPERPRTYQETQNENTKCPKASKICAQKGERCSWVDQETNVVKEVDCCRYESKYVPPPASPVGGTENTNLSCTEPMGGSGSFICEEKTP